MSTLYLITGEVRYRVAAMWRALAETLRLECSNWQGSETSREALKQFSQEVDERARRASEEKGGRA